MVNYLCMLDRKYNWNTIIVRDPTCTDDLIEISTPIQKSNYTTYREVWPNENK